LSALGIERVANTLNTSGRTATTVYTRFRTRKYSRDWSPDAGIPDEYYRRQRCDSHDGTQAECRFSRVVKWKNGRTRGSMRLKLFGAKSVIVLVKHPGESLSKVIDGQQRLTTLTILPSVLRDLTTDQGIEIPRGGLEGTLGYGLNPPCSAIAAASRAL
jgi:hypothetical protein